jgi:hypothetical protein
MMSGRLQLMSARHQPRSTRSLQGQGTLRLAAPIHSVVVGTTGAPRRSVRQRNNHGRMTMKRIRSIASSLVTTIGFAVAIGCAAQPPSTQPAGEILAASASVTAQTEVTYYRVEGTVDDMRISAFNARDVEVSGIHAYRAGTGHRVVMTLGAETVELIAHPEGAPEIVKSTAGMSSVVSHWEILRHDLASVVPYGDWGCFPCVLQGAACAAGGGAVVLACTPPLTLTPVCPAAIMADLACWASFSAHCVGSCASDDSGGGGGGGDPNPWNNENADCGVSAEFSHPCF